MKSKLIILVVCMSFTTLVHGAVTWSNPITFNTAIKSPGYNSLVSLLQADESWSVCQTFNGTYIPAIRFNNGTSGWAGINTSYPSDWITWPKYNCNSSDPTDHSCKSGPQDLYFKIDFNLPTTVFSVDFEIFADDKVVDLYVNGNVVWSPNGGGSLWNQAIHFQSCSNWTVGVNSIIIHVQSSQSLIGLKVTNYAPPTISLNGSSTVCKNSVNAYTAVITPSPTSASYSWSWPSGWGVQGVTNTNILSTTATGNSGVIQVTANSGTACLVTATLAVTVVPLPTVNIVASSTLICPGDPITLTANGANSYTWVNPPVPAAQYMNSSLILNPGPAAQTTYSVTGFDIYGCKDGTNVTVFVLPAPIVNLTANPQVICSGIGNTLTASGANTYTWFSGSPPTAIGNNQILIVNNSPAIVYTVTGTGPNGCTASATVNLLMGLPVNLSTIDYTLCTNAGSCTNISATTTLTAPVNYVWSPGALNGQTVNVCPLINTIYTVSATSSSACPASATLAVTIVTNCCASPTAGLTHITSLGSSYVNTSYVLDSPETLTASTSFLNCELWITPEGKITVPSGMVLDLDHSHLFACGINMWPGIVVQDGGRITTSSQQINSTLIEDALVAIELDNISLANSSPNPPIDIYRLIFNRNYIGIKISNLDPAYLNDFALSISGCVFSSRTLTYSTFPTFPIGWPAATVMGAGALRVANNPTTGLVPPHQFPGYPQTNLKQPYTQQPGHIGIKIENIGNPNTYSSNATWVDIGNTYPGANTNDFNLFDGLGNGIEIIDGSLKTKNNVFQSMKQYTVANSPFGGNGIHSKVNGLMNTRLELHGTTVDEGNRFWNCFNGVYAENVFVLSANNAIFRSDHTVATALQTPTLGDCGIKDETNRYELVVQECQFNNVKNGISLNTPAVTSNYEVDANGPTAGIYAGVILIEDNYFGPEVLSITPYSTGTANATEYMSEAIQLNTPNTTGWHNPPVLAGSWIQSNRMDRVFRGISINSLEDQILSVQGNSIYIEDDYTFGNPAFGYGIAALRNTGNLAIQSNTLEAQNSILNTSVSLVYCNRTSGTGSPRVFCNFTRNSYYGFQFDDSNPGTDWQGNAMCTHYAGMALTNNGVIGTQGSPTSAIENWWMPSPNPYCQCQPWNTPQSPYETWCENSDPTLSPLYVCANYLDQFGFWQPTMNYVPTFNWGNNPTQVYSLNPPPSLFPVNGHNSANIDCFMTQYNPVPGWRTSQQSTITVNIEDNTLSQIALYPNPTDGRLTIVNDQDNETLTVRITDVTGKQVFYVEGINNSNNAIDFSELPASIYFIEINGSNNKVIRNKLIKTN
jgi:hypothetical protein